MVLNPCDFCLRGFLKNRACGKAYGLCQIWNSLISSITHQVVAMDPESPLITAEHAIIRIKYVIDANGMHI